MSLGEVIQETFANSGLPAEAQPSSGDQNSPINLAPLNEQSNPSDVRIWVYVTNRINEAEDAYWKLYYEYRRLDALVRLRNHALRKWQEIKAQLGTRRGAEADEEAFAAKSYFEYSSRVHTTLKQLYFSERTLRYMMGITITDGRIIRPSDDPELAEITFDWNTEVKSTISRFTSSPYKNLPARSFLSSLRDAQRTLSDVIGQVQYARMTMMSELDRLAAAKRLIQTLKLAEEVGRPAELQLLIYSHADVAEAEIAYFRQRIEYSIAVKNVHLVAGTLFDYHGLTLAKNPTQISRLAAQPGSSPLPVHLQFRDSWAVADFRMHHAIFNTSINRKPLKTRPHLTKRSYLYLFIIDPEGAVIREMAFPRDLIEGDRLIQFLNELPDGRYRVVQKGVGNNPDRTIKDVMIKDGKLMDQPKEPKDGGTNRSVP